MIYVLRQTYTNARKSTLCVTATTYVTLIQSLNWPRYELTRQHNMLGLPSVTQYVERA